MTGYVECLYTTLYYVIETSCSKKYNNIILGIMEENEEFGVFFV